MTTNCKYCGHDNYHIKNLYQGFKQKLFIIECAQCKETIIPVVVWWFEKEEDFYKRCEKLWDESNEGVEIATDSPDSTQ